MNEHTQPLTPSVVATDVASNNVTSTTNPPRLSNQQAASQRARALRLHEIQEMESSASEINMLAQKYPTFDSNASILVGIKELLGFFDPNEFSQKLEMELSRMINEYSHLGVSFSGMDKTQAETVLVKLQEADLRKVERLHLAFDTLALTQSSAEVDVQSMAQALSAIGRNNPDLAITLHMLGQTLSVEDCKILGKALAGSGVTKLMMDNVLPQNAEAMGAFMQLLKDSRVTHLKWSDIKWPSSPLQIYDIQNQFRHGLRDTRLSALNVSGVGIGCNQASYLVLSCPKSLEKLELTNNQLQKYRTNRFFYAVGKTCLKELDVSGNFIGNSGAAHFANLLRRNRQSETQLVKVRLAANLIEDEGAQRIAEALMKPECISNLKITIIDLRKNLFGPESAAALDQAVQAYQGRLQILHDYNPPEASHTS